MRSEDLAAFTRKCAQWSDDYLLAEFSKGAAAFVDGRYFAALQSEMARRGLSIEVATALPAATPQGPLRQGLWRDRHRAIRPALAAALFVTFLLTAIVLISDGLRSDSSWAAAALERLPLTGIVSILVLRGDSRARWILGFWYGYCAISTVAVLFKIPLPFAGPPLLMLVCYVWSIVELGREHVRTTVP